MRMHRMLMLVATLAITSLQGISGPPQTTSGPVLKTARHHPMQYYISFPKGWTAKKKWPVVIAADGANKGWLENAQVFAKVRDEKDYPFILVTPVILTNGGRDLRHMSQYNYAPEVWDEEEKTGRCVFDFDGLKAVMDDVHELYGGEDKVFFTGASAGGHLTWAVIFRRPEWLRAAAPVVSNWTGRCMTSEVEAPVEISNAPERVNLPVKVFDGDKDPSFEMLGKQHMEAVRLAQEHGYRNVSRYIVPGGEHTWMAEQVLPYFYSLLKH